MNFAKILLIKQRKGKIMKFDMTINEAKEKLCPFMAKDGEPIHCVGDKCMSWEFTRTQVTTPYGGNNGNNFKTDLVPTDSGNCKLCFQ